MTFESKIQDKPVEEYSEEEVKQMFIDMFFWVVENRLEWLQECISRKKAQLQKVLSG